MFAGSSAATIAALGDKLAERRAARAADVPHVPRVPGTLEPAPVDRPDQPAAVLAAVDAVGFPLVKAVAGCGGRGMRRVVAADDLLAALLAGWREAAAAFGDGSVHLESEITPAPHIEVQIVGDATGQVIALGERDRSAQRRYRSSSRECPRRA